MEIRWCQLGRFDGVHRTTGTGVLTCPTLHVWNVQATGRSNGTVNTSTRWLSNRTRQPSAAGAIFLMLAAAFVRDQRP